MELTEKQKRLWPGLAEELEANGGEATGSAALMCAQTGNEEVALAGLRSFLENDKKGSAKEYANDTAPITTPNTIKGILSRIVTMGFHKGIETELLRSILRENKKINWFGADGVLDVLSRLKDGSGFVRAAEGSAASRQTVKDILARNDALRLLDESRIELTKKELGLELFDAAVNGRKESSKWLAEKGVSKMKAGLCSLIWLARGDEELFHLLAEKSDRRSLKTGVDEWDGSWVSMTYGLKMEEEKMSLARSWLEREELRKTGKKEVKPSTRKRL